MDDMDKDELRNIIAWGVAKGILRAGASVAVALFVLAFIVAAFGLGYDATDRPPLRSGLAIKTDYQTGLQYLITAKGGITPRLDAQGNHMREVK